MTTRVKMSLADIALQLRDEGLQTQVVRYKVVGFVEDGVLERVRAKGSVFRAETPGFVADPQIFTDVCEPRMRFCLRLPPKRRFPRSPIRLARAVGAAELSWAQVTPSCCDGSVRVPP